ncbi:MAG: 2-C-methyl-D-erythritol 4-phosphate cytidylyltransferase [Acetobacter sp.]|nr:2-C-methyl-D-erythritol 4-phosphate cytidylyltransferase [Bacteroides sp.]MCM1341553.1 2-C-methyl-D-erythritol 4-phosphate cytidylyltransferase [Acetobacter sp.]MCM1433630.1 2-C-methyl-D-erythritol 4-phosphate cytidylyltransferase [Clostridiales bacterium]
MNIVVILANGIGARFGSNVPKQFHKINGKMVIEYVIDAILEAESVDKILVVTNIEANKSYLTAISALDKVDFTGGGDTRNMSLDNAIKFIDANYSCSKMIVCDAVRPMITGELIDKYFDYLDNNTAVVTAQKITDSLGCYDIPQIHRDRYYLMQSPEAFDFETLRNSFDPDSTLTEVTQQLPEGSKIELYFDFTNNFKLTYPADLKYLEALINARDNDVDLGRIFDSVKRLNRYLFENYPSQTKQWKNTIDREIPNLLKKWQITDYEVIKTSHFGIIFMADSVKYGNCVLKIIPPFINRYEQERSGYQKLASAFMCELYDFDDACSAILMEQLDSSKIEIDSRLHKFFEKVISSYREIEISSEYANTFHDYEAILYNKLNEDNFDYKKDEIMMYVNKAVSLYKNVFGGEKKSLIHGDMHRYNLMYNDNDIRAIDPIGYIAPCEIDIARFIGTEFTENEQMTVENYKKFVDFFSDIVDKDKLKSAIIIDIIFRLHNSIFENDSFELTDKWLRILSLLI